MDRGTYECVYFIRIREYQFRLVMQQDITVSVAVKRIVHQPPPLRHRVERVVSILSQPCIIGYLRTPAVSSLCSAVLSTGAHIVCEHFQLATSDGSACFHFLVISLFAVIKPKSRNLGDLFNF